MQCKLTIKWIIGAIFCLASWTVIWGQIKIVKLNKKNEKILNSAIVHIGQAKYLEAEKELQAIIENYPYASKPYFVLADMYYNIKAYALSILQYRKALQIDPDNNTYFYLPMAISFSGLGEFDSALVYLNLYKKKMNPHLINHERVKSLEENFLFALDYSKKYNSQMEHYDFKIYNLGDSINTALSEYFPSLNFNNDKIIFTRRIKGVSRANAKDAELTAEEKKALEVEKGSMAQVENEDFFESNLVNGIWTKARPLPGELNDITNEGGSNLSLDGRYLFFTGCNFDNSKGSCDIYVSEKKDGQWSKAENLSDEINTEFWESQPSISADGKMLFFASRRPGGFGGSDLYVSLKNNRGKWGQPINLGPTFNTPGDEISPFIHPDNRTLYFASNKLPGYGGFDLFKVRRVGNNKWTKPINLGHPINTIENETNIFVSSNGTTAFFSSDKGDSKGKIDIFQFELRSDLNLDQRHLGSNPKLPLDIIYSYTKCGVKKPKQTQVIKWKLNFYF